MFIFLSFTIVHFWKRNIMYALAMPFVLSDFPLMIISIGRNSWKYIKWYCSYFCVLWWSVRWHCYVYVLYWHWRLRRRRSSVWHCVGHDWTRESYQLTNLMHKNFSYNKFIIRLYMFRALCAHHQAVKIVLYSIWYHHTCRWPSGAQVESGLRSPDTARKLSANLYDIYHCCVYSEKLLMMDRVTARNM